MIYGYLEADFLRRFDYILRAHRRGLAPDKISFCTEFSTILLLAFFAAISITPTEDLPRAAKCAVPRMVRQFANAFAKCLLPYLDQIVNLRMQRMSVSATVNCENPVTLAHIVATIG